MDRRGIRDHVQWDDEPVTEPAAAGAPPRRPPTTVGQDDDPAGDGPEPGPPWREAIGLDVPLAETSLPPRITRSLTRAGYRTVRDTANLSDTRLERIGLDLGERHTFRRWRFTWIDHGRI